MVYDDDDDDDKYLNKPLTSVETTFVCSAQRAELVVPPVKSYLSVCVCLLTRLA